MLLVDRRQAHGSCARMSRFWVIPLVIFALVVAPFLIWGETLVAFIAPDPEAGVFPGGREWLWLIAIALLVADILIPVPTTSVIAALGIVYGPVLGSLVGLVGTMAAAFTGYGVGRLFGRPLSERLIGDGLSRGERLFANHGGWIVAASRWMPILPEVISVVAGVSRMRFAAFAAAALCGLVPFCAVFATFGHLGADRPAATLIVSAIAPFALWWVARNFGGLGGKS